MWVNCCYVRDTVEYSTCSKDFASKKSINLTVKTSDFRIFDEYSLTITETSMKHIHGYEIDETS